MKFLWSILSLLDFFHAFKAIFVLKLAFVKIWPNDHPILAIVIQGAEDGALLHAPQRFAPQHARPLNVLQ